MPGLGRLPVNALTMAGFSIFGIAHPGFWLIGLGIEALWLMSAVGSDRFRALIDASRPQRVFAAATAAVREAMDGPAFRRRVKDETGFDLSMTHR